MKNLKGISIIPLILIFLVTGTFVNSAMAIELASTPSLPWKNEYIDHDSNTSALAMAINPSTGSPIVFFHDADLDDIIYAARVGAGQGDCGTSNAWQCSITSFGTTNGLLDAAFWDDPNGYSSTAGLVYYDSGQDALRYFYLWPNGSGITTILDFDYVPANQWTIGSKPSIAFDQNGQAHVVVTINSLDNYTLLAYMRHTGISNTSCTGVWHGDEYWECKFIIIGQNAVDDPSITISGSNLPRIAYQNPGAHELMYTYETDKFPSETCSGNPNWRCAVIDSDLLTGYFPSIAYGDGKLFIAYYNGSYLRLAEYVGSGGNCVPNNSWKCITIDDISNGYQPVDISLAMDGSQPVIAYQDKDNGPQSIVKLAQTAVRAGMEYGNCGPENPFSTWECQVIDQGPYSLGNDLDLMLGSAGQAWLAYLEDNYDDREQHVLFNYQYFSVFLPAVLK